MLHTKSLSLLLIFILVSSALSWGCNRQEAARLQNAFRKFFLKKSEIPSRGDATPPSLYWEVTDLSSNIMQTVGQPENILNLRYGSKFRVVMIAEDPESGIKAMSQEESSGFNCKVNNGVGVTSEPYYPRRSAYIPDLGEYVFRRYEMRIDTVSLNFCANYNSFQSGFYSFSGQATNFKNGVNNSSLVIQIIPN
jgi:hypothetical protein